MTIKSGELDLAKTEQEELNKLLNKLVKKLANACGSATEIVDHLVCSPSDNSKIKDIALQVRHTENMTRKAFEDLRDLVMMSDGHGGMDGSLR